MSTFHFIKLGDIALVGNYIFWLSLLLGLLLDKLLKSDENEETMADSEDENSKISHRIKLFVLVFIQVGCVSMMAYFVRKAVQMIPYPLDGVAGFQHSKLKELNGGVLIAFALLLFGGNNIRKNIGAIFK